MWQSLVDMSNDPGIIDYGYWKKRIEKPPSTLSRIVNMETICQYHWVIETTRGPVIFGICNRRQNVRHIQNNAALDKWSSFRLAE